MSRSKFLAVYNNRIVKCKFSFSILENINGKILNNKKERNKEAKVFEGKYFITSLIVFDSTIKKTKKSILYKAFLNSKFVFNITLRRFKNRTKQIL